MRLAFHKLMFWLWFITRGYYLWSRLMRWLLEDRFRTQELTEYVSLAQLESALGKMKWMSDPLKGKLDIISLPEKVEALWRMTRADAVTGNEYIGDCDEFAVYSATAIQSLIDRHKFIGRSPMLLTMNWLDSAGKYHGHNVCAFFDLTTSKWSHIGNWFGGKSQGGFKSVEDIVEWFAFSSSPDGAGEVIGWATARPDLRGLIQLKIG